MNTKTNKKIIANLLSTAQKQHDIHQKIDKTKQQLQKLEQLKQSEQLKARKTEQTQKVQKPQEAVKPAKVIKKPDIQTSTNNGFNSTDEEDVCDALIELGLPQEFKDNEPNKQFHSASEIIDILEKYNCLHLAINTLRLAKSNYQIKQTPTSTYTIVNSSSVDLDQAKKTIEQALFYRVINTVYYSFNPYIMTYYDELPTGLKDTPNPGPFVIVWALRHYGFGRVFKQLVHRTHKISSVLFSKTPELETYPKNIDGKKYDYLGSKNNAMSVLSSTVETFGKNAYLAICNLETNGTSFNPGVYPSVTSNHDYDKRNNPINNVLKNSRPGARDDPTENLTGTCADYNEDCGCGCEDENDNEDEDCGYDCGYDDEDENEDEGCCDCGSYDDEDDDDDDGCC